MQTLNTSLLRSLLAVGTVATVTAAQAAPQVVAVASVGGTFAGNTITSLQVPAYDSSGTLWFMGVNGTDQFIAQGNAVPWKSSFSTSPVLSGTSVAFAVSTNGFIYNPRIAPQTGGVYIKTGASTTFLTPYDLAPGSPPYYVRTVVGPQMISDGTAYFIGTLSLNPSGISSPFPPRALYKRSPGGVITKVFATTSGSTIAGQAVISTWNSGMPGAYSISPDGTQTALVVNFDTGSDVDDTALVKNFTTVVAQEAVPWTGAAAIENFGKCEITNAGDVYYSGTTFAPTLENAFLAKNSDPILTELDKVDQISLSGLSLTQFVLNAQNKMVMSWGTSDTNHTLFISDADLPLAGKRVVGIGDQIDLDGDFAADAEVSKIFTTGFRPIVLNNQNTIALKIEYTAIGGGGTPTQSIVTIPYPKPGEVDRDGEVGPSDFERVVAAFGATPADVNWDAWADLDFDGEVGPGDFEIVVSNFGS